MWNSTIVDVFRIAAATLGSHPTLSAKYATKPGLPAWVPSSLNPNIKLLVKVLLQIDSLEYSYMESWLLPIQQWKS